MSSETPTTTATEPAKRSAVEEIKEASRWLRGTIHEELADPNLDHLSEPNKQLLKFHGSYQQEDRDARKNRSKAGVGKHYMYMVRLKLPGGKMTGEQYLALDAIADEFANGTLRFTTRQSIQLHGILKGNLKNSIYAINQALISTLGACGDVNRNVMSCPAPLNDPVRQEMQRQADAIAAHLAPKSKAYYDIWINGKITQESDDFIEPIYGKVYLPRKFKTGLSLPHDNCVDIFAQDLGFLAITNQSQLVGYNLMVGGGMGRTHGNPNTFPHLSKYVAFLEPDQVVAAAEAVIKLYRDHGNRADRKRARIKYLMHDWGVEKFREVFARDYWGKPLQPPRPVEITGVDLHHGWQPQGDGKWFLGLSIENGRVKDEGSLRLKSGLREIVRRFKPNVRVSAQQDVLLCDIDPTHKPAIDALLNEYGIERPENLSLVRKWSMACPAIPTCGLAISESERVLPSIIDEMETALAELGLSEQHISIRMTGCPNGCARPYQSEVGIVGRSGDKYMLFVGGSSLGDRLNFPLQDLVPRSEIVPKLKVLIGHFKDQRHEGESFGDFCTRLGAEQLRSLIGAPAPKMH